MNKKYTKFHTVNGVTTLNLAPDFVDISLSEFPFGIPLGALYFDGICKDAVEFHNNTEKFFEEVFNDVDEYLVEEPEYFKGKEFIEPVIELGEDSFYAWSAIYGDVDFDGEEAKSIYYVRLVPSFVSLEYTGYSHGISVFNKNFDTKEEALIWAAKIENFMNFILMTYINKK